MISILYTGFPNLFLTFKLDNLTSYTDPLKIGVKVLVQEGVVCRAHIHTCSKYMHVACTCNMYVASSAGLEAEQSPAEGSARGQMPR